MCVDRCHKSSPGHGAKEIGSGTRMTNSRASIQLTLHVANRVPIPRYRKSCRRIISYTSYSRTNDCIYNGYVNNNLEHNTMINIDTVAHMNMHYTQY